jgi:hypothetical protein
VALQTCGCGSLPLFPCKSINLAVRTDSLRGHYANAGRDAEGLRIRKLLYLPGLYDFVESRPYLFSDYQFNGMLNRVMVANFVLGEEH